MQYSLGVSSGHCISSIASTNFRVLCLALDVTIYQGYSQALRVSCRPGYITCLFTHSSCNLQTQDGKLQCRHSASAMLLWFCHLLILKQIVAEILKKDLQVFLLNFPLVQRRRQHALPVLYDAFNTSRVFKHHPGLQANMHESEHKKRRRCADAAST